MLQEYGILCLVAALGGAVNAVAGGGTLLTFPALFAALGSSGEAAVMANATSTVALLPGALGAIGGYWSEIKHEGRWVRLLLLPSLIGGLIGSLLLVLLPGDSFKAAVPWLILAAALLFTLQPRIARWFGVGAAHDAPRSAGLVATVVGFQFLVAIYGGYFGAGIGILMLSALALMGMDDIHRMNAVKILLNAAINGTSVVVFVASGNIHWPFAIAMAAASVIGGYLAAHTAKQMNKSVVRAIVVLIGFTLAAYYFYREFVA